MRKFTAILLLLLVACTACHRRNDPVVAQVYQYKLYASEVRQGMPVGLSQEDSLAMVNFEKEMMDYRNSLLINRYYDKLWQQDTAANAVSDQEISDFVRSLDSRYTVDKEIVRVNYVKLSRGSSLLAPVKSILFDEQKRVEEKETLVAMLGDSIEYLLDDDAWLYLDDLQNEVAFDIEAERTVGKGEKLRIEKEVGDQQVLLVILDYRSQRSVNETKEERAAAGMLLTNQRKTQFINQYVQDLYDKAVKEGKVVQ